VGCDTMVTCESCRETIDCGYGSYRSFNLREERGIKKHLHCKGPVTAWSHDWCYHKGDDLMIQARAGGDLYIENEKTFKQIPEADDE